MARYKINDPIHRIIPFNEKEKSVIDHPYFQRLRHIKQLSFVSYVFPGAVHDRFSHSLGAMHMASLLSRQFFFNEEQSVLARILSPKEKQFLTLMMRFAGLLHDIGHAPFSHAAEAHMPPVKTLAIPSGWFREKAGERRAKHEDYSALLIWELSQGPPSHKASAFANVSADKSDGQGKNSVLSEEESEIIASLIHKNIKIPSSWHIHFSSKINTKALHTLVRSWISGDIDIDRMDYLLRDSYFTGVPYGNYDVSWLVHALGVIERKGDYITSISDAGVHAFEYYLLARYNMFMQVYFHKTVRCFEYYFQEALSAKEISYSIPSDLDEYIGLRDTTLFESLMRYAKEHPYSWSWRLMSRKPAKRIARVWRKDTNIDALFENIKRDCAKKNAHPFLVISQSKFLDYEESVSSEKDSVKTHSLFSALSMTPLVVIRKHFGIRSALNMEDYSFILKQYHQDISIGDIFIPSEEYQKDKHIILPLLKRYFKASPSEIILNDKE